MAPVRQLEDRLKPTTQRKRASAPARLSAAKRGRLPRAERRSQMIDDAVSFFAEHGFAASTRELARHLGVTQALVYKHFGSKDAFISALLDQTFANRPGRLSAILDDESVPIASRLASFYLDAGSSKDKVRLFVRAGLEGWPIPARHGAKLTRDVFRPVIGALRRAAKLSDFARRPLMRGERELAMMLHASIAFLGIREHVYRMPMVGDRTRLVRFYVDIFLPGAIAQLRRLHRGDSEDGLSIEQLAPA